jgi:enoyl-CoA hydratase
MEYKNIKFEIEDHVALITVNRPKALNALNSETLKELESAVEEVAADDNIFVFIITGQGKAFVAGADIAEMRDFNPEEARRFAKLGHKVFNRISSLCKPSIAAINGYALGGGCELALACDIRVANDLIKIGQPEVGLGITPGFGATKRMVQVVGESKAKELIFTGEYLDANQAKEIGLVNKVVKQDVLMPEVMKMAHQIASKAQLAVRYAKLAIDRSHYADSQTASHIETSAFSLCFANEDQKEGMSAFLEKRNPEFKCK